MHVWVEHSNSETLRNFMKKRTFQMYSVVMYALVLVAIAFLTYEAGRIESRIAAIEYRQDLQNNFDASNIRRGALRSTLDKTEQQNTVTQP